MEFSFENKIRTMKWAKIYQYFPGILDNFCWYFLKQFTMIFKKNLKNLLKIGGKFTQWNFQKPKNQIQLTDPSLLYYIWIEWQKLQLHFKFFLKEILLCKIKWVFPFSYKNSTIQLYVAEAIQFIIKKRFQSSFKKRWETFFLHRILCEIKDSFDEKKFL